MRKIFSKKTIFLSILFFSFFAMAQSAEAATYYVATSGDDSYDGSASVFQGGLVGPKKTIAAGLALLKNSDDLKIRQGLYFESGLNLNSGASGTFADRVTISNYNGESVYISGGFPIDASAWLKYNGQIYKDLSGSPYYFNLYWAPKNGSLDELQGIRLGYYRGGAGQMDEEGEWTREYGNGWSHYFYVGNGKSIADYAMIGTFINNENNRHVFDLTNEHDYVTIDGIWFIASVGVILTTPTSDYIEIKNSRFYGIMGNDRGIRFQGDNCLIENCESRLTSSYFISTTPGCNPSKPENLTIRNSKFSYNFGNIIHIGGKGMRIQNNEFTHFATSYWYSNEPEYKHAEGIIGHTPGDGCFSDLIIENNYFHDVDAAIRNPFGVDEQKWDAEVTESGMYKGNDTGHAFYSASGLPNQGSGFIYRYNVHEGYMPFLLTCEQNGCSYKNFSLYGNIFSNINDERTCEGCTALGMSAVNIGLNGFTTGSSTYENLRIYNNLFYNYRTGLELGSRHGDTLFTGDSFVKNNIFHIQNGWNMANEGAGIFFDDGNEIDQMISDYNLFYRSNRNEIFGYREGSIFGLTIQQLRNDFNHDLHSIVADPLLVNPQIRNYHLRFSSPAINAGTNAGLARDFEGNQIIGSPDIGAYEYQGNDTTPPAVPSGLSVN